MVARAILCYFIIYVVLSLFSLSWNFPFWKPLCARFLCSCLPVAALGFHSLVRGAIRHPCSDSGSPCFLGRPALVWIPERPGTIGSSLRSVRDRARTHYWLSPTHWKRHLLIWFWNPRRASRQWEKGGEARMAPDLIIQVPQRILTRNFINRCGRARHIFLADIRLRKVSLLEKNQIQ